MKVLFAVSSENISDAIIKRYQKQYKEILSYKNVYYFNAILKEIQKDKTYDRIIISEDLEPFSNNNYDTIDKFIFEKLDSISDEAEDSSGKETSIILICTDRRQKGSAILVKLFGIGVYNALLGNDRSMEEVCKLISKPRTKKEAKMYYRIDTDDVNYKAENENEVSEVEIQNILAHFKKLGKNTAKYSDSFNNIAIQYNDEQLKIIVNCLPINVKAVLESECERYQELMAVTSGIRSVKNMAASSDSMENAVRQGIKSKSVGQAGNITKPIVIPSAVRNAKNKTQVLKNNVQPVKAKTISTVKNTQTPTQNGVPQQQIPQQVQQPVQQQVRTQKPVRPIQVRPSDLSEGRPQVQPQVEKEELNEEPINQAEQEPMVQQTRGYQRPRRPVPGMSRQMVQEPESVQSKPMAEDDLLVEENILPGLDDDLEKDDVLLPGIDDNITEDEYLGINLEELEDADTLTNIEEDAETKRGRGRPRKTPVEGAILKPKGKRGRPRKIQDEELENEEEVSFLPGMEVEDDDSILPGFDDEIEDNNSLLPGMEVEDEETMLPGLDDENLEDDTLLPGMEDDIEDDSSELLPGFDEEATVLPGMGFEDEETDEDYTDEVALPGLEGLDDLDDIDESDLDSDDTLSEEDFDLLPGMDSNEQVNDFAQEDNSSELLPGFNEEAYSEDVQNSEEELLPGFEEDLSGEELLPGIENFETEEVPAGSPNVNLNSNVVESIKPRVDYSMSSLNSLITKDKKIVTFIGTSKNGVSFLVNNLAALFSSLGINTAILDMTKNKNSYYIYTKNEDELRNIAFNSIEKLQNGYAEGIRVDKNLSVYTALPNDGKNYSNAEPILSTLIQNHALVLIDCDYDTDLSYFAYCQEMYLVQSMDILTIQPLTAFLRELKINNILEPEKIRIVINKELKVRSLSIKAIIGGLSYYNDPGMSFMTELFNKDMVKACTLPFEDNAYSKYLEGIVNCNISLNGFSKMFLSKLKVLGDMVYPLTSKQTYGKGQVPTYNPNAFSNSMNDTLNKMKKKY